jgi:hypothetical protein
VTYTVSGKVLKVELDLKNVHGVEVGPKTLNKIELE